MEKTTLCSDVTLAKVLDAVDNGRTNGASDTVVVRLANTTNGGDGRVGLEEIVLGKILGQ